MTIRIVGAGMAGLFAANMLKRRDDVILFERQKELPNNHSAVLRFRTSIVSEVLGIPFRKVTVIKAVDRWKNPVADSLAYSFKCLGEYRSDRSVIKGDEVVERWIAPPDLIERMARGLTIRYDCDYDFHRKTTDPVISTIPMPSLMTALEYADKPPFGYLGGMNVRTRIALCDAYVSIAVPDPSKGFSRVSITGDELIVECPTTVIHDDDWGFRMVRGALDLLGISKNRIHGGIEVRQQLYSKIVPIDEEARRNFLFWCSTVRGYCWNLGRYATWRPGLLMDDLVKDVRVITKLMESGSRGYDSERIER